MPRHRFCSMKVRVLRPFCARFSILTAPSLKSFGSASPQPVSGRFSGSFFAIVESPARKIVTGSFARALAASALSKSRSKKYLAIPFVVLAFGLTARLSTLRVPAVRAAENSLRREGVGFRPRQPARPRDARRRVRAESPASILRVADGLLALGEVPVVPALGPHDLGHLRVYEHHGGVCAPRASEVSLDPGRSARDAAV